MKYGRIINGRAVPAPSPLVIDGVKHWTNIAAVYLSQGYKQFIYTNRPVRDGYYYTEIWSDDDATATQGWEKREIEVVPDETADMQAALDEIGITPEVE